jgi:hypothetical protein
MVIRATNRGRVHHDRWELLPYQRQSQETGAIAGTLLDGYRVTGARKLDSLRGLRMPEPHDVPAAPTVAMRLLLDLTANLAVAGKWLAPSTAAEQRPVGHDECATSDDHRLPAQRPVHREEGEGGPNTNGQIGTGSPETRYDRRAATDPRGQPKARDDQDERAPNAA